MPEKTPIQKELESWNELRAEIAGLKASLLRSEDRAEKALWVADQWLKHLLKLLDRYEPEQAKEMRAAANSVGLAEPSADA